MALEEWLENKNQVSNNLLSFLNLPSVVIRVHVELIDYKDVLEMKCF